ncbi:glutamate--tRNA ligase [Candidatus Micrarchaeota archaeon CG08_land_8_20_14_0_20_49_17]|nr:MAG: glutamate--tRNA ligase [Candidatus Micrarchaeota archaeon CG1_02_49_24]PIU10090.1 MAG: glutamate--tRNA ligase [Candidatus Micrarchaeota archaeon CG08_land_8_20_14_0_20_49_17]HII53668.1 glutamate--tRNA ligase [Candidatus Micrarchaeota archaeon]
MEIEGLIKKYALKNAFDFGKANEKAVAGRVLGESAEARKDIAATMKLVAGIVKEINALGKKEIEKELKKYGIETSTPNSKPETRNHSIVLPDAKMNEVVTRFPPEPNGHLHIGHAKALFLNYEAANAYSGKLLIRFDDTNPEKESQEYVESIAQDIKWLGIEHSAPTFTSDSIEKIYAYGEKLIRSGNAYACTCPQEVMKENRMKKMGCACRERDAAGNLALFTEMKTTLAAGKAVIRFRGDMASENTVMRDPTLFRIIDVPHYRQGRKYRAWPNYDFVAPVMDALEGVTHAMRSKEYELRDELYACMQEALGLRNVKIVGFSRLGIEGVPVSKREIKKLIDDKKVDGWDDPRLVTIAALKRRGIRPEAIMEFVLSFGLSKVESTPKLEKLLALNKKIIDPVARRYFFARGKKVLKVNGAKPEAVSLKAHPSGNLGMRKLEATGEYYIDENDFEALKIGDAARLKDFCAVRVVGKKKDILETEKVEEIDNETQISKPETRIIQWVPKESAVKCEVMVASELFDGEKFNGDSLRMDKGYCEANCAGMEIGVPAQFERYGFVMLDKKENSRLIFIYMHK